VNVWRRVVSGTLAAMCLESFAAPRAAPLEAWPPVPPADLSSFAASDFADDELELPYYVAQFHRVANRVVESGDDRGFIDVHVWRNARDQRPHNARVMESILSLAWFYATKRPWNPYYGSPAVRLRLEAALEFWCRKQHVDGRFSEYGPGEWNLAPTAFATKFMGETLALLENEDGPPIDRLLLQRVAATDRRAVEAVLTIPELYEHGKDFSNQYTNVYAGGLAYLSRHPDATLADRLAATIRTNTHIFQSPAGYFYEQKGPDWGYNLGTHQSNLRMALHYCVGTELGRVLIEEERRFIEWVSYNAVLEPDDQGFVLNRAIETRQRTPYLPRLELDRRAAPPADVPLAAAFLATQDEVARARAQQREELVRTWPVVRPFEPGNNAFPPYTFLHRRHPQWNPTTAERAAAVAVLPYLKSDRFIHQRMDRREPLTFTYVRRPRYYAAFNAGKRLMEQQRYGLGLVWTRETGAMLQSQTGTSDAAWGTRSPGAPQVYEAGDLAAEFLVDTTAVEPTAGVRDLPDGRLSVRYRLGERGVKSLTFDEKEIAVSIDHAGPFEEQVPLLLAPADTLVTSDGQVALVHEGRTRAALHFDRKNRARAVETDLHIASKRVVVVTIAADDRLQYSVRFDDPAPRPLDAPTID
jgi:hypothetical protein